MASAGYLQSLSDGQYRLGKATGHQTPKKVTKQTKTNSGRKPTAEEEREEKLKKGPWGRQDSPGLKDHTHTTNKKEEERAPGRQKRTGAEYATHAAESDECVTQRCPMGDLDHPKMNTSARGKQSTTTLQAIRQGSKWEQITKRCQGTIFLWSAPVAFRRVALETPEWTSRDSNHHRQSVSADKTNAIPTEPSGRLGSAKGQLAQKTKQVQKGHAKSKGEEKKRRGVATSYSV